MTANSSRARFGHGYKIIGFDDQHRFLIGDTTTAEQMVDAVEFGPALIVNGQKIEELGSVESLQPVPPSVRPKISPC